MGARLFAENRSHAVEVADVFLQRVLVTRRRVAAASSEEVITWGVEWGGYFFWKFF